MPRNTQNSPASPELWVWQWANLHNSEGVAAAIAAIDTAAAAGYNGVAFWDVGAQMINVPKWVDPQGDFLKIPVQYAESKGMKVSVGVAPFGYSNEVLESEPDLAEAQRVLGSPFEVSGDGRSLKMTGSPVEVRDAGFEDGESWLRKRDPGTSIDRAVAHGGRSSAAIHDAPGDARFVQALKLTPWRQYHLRVFVKTKDFHGESPAALVLDSGNTDEVRLTSSVEMKPTQDWTELNAAFNSQDSTSALLYLGAWGGSRGSAWFDDVEVNETAMVHLIRRDGAPFRVYDPRNGTTFEEGKDYAPVALAKPLGVPFGSYQDPPEIALPATTALKPGERVAIDSYSAQPIVPPTEFGMCLTAAGVQKYMAENAERLTAALPASTGFFMQYDEMRNLNSCASCRAKGMTAGELLAWHVGETIQLYRARRPDARMYVWSDMFDPFHNAHDHYFLAEGSLAGSWKGLPADVIVMNWNPEKLKQSYGWFGGMNSRQRVAYRQIISGSDDGVTAAARLKSAAGVPGIIGVMYTTWGPDYSRLKDFAGAVKGAWAGYLASLH